MRLDPGDRKPDLVIDLTDDLADVPLGDATNIRIIAAMDRLPDPVFDGAPDDVTGNAVTHLWAPGETDAEGRLWVVVKVTWADGTRTFPELGELAVDIG